VKEQFELQTGEPIELFLDKDALEWGDKWKDKIDDSLATVAFFIPVMTPRYFMSPECRRELHFFARRANNLGIKELVLPLYYVEVPGVEADAIEDDLIALVRTFQREDWRELRYEDVLSKAYRQAVSRLAARLVAANKYAEEVDLVEAARRLEQGSDEEGDGEPGEIDRLARAEEALPSWTDTLRSIGQEIEAIGRVIGQATSDIAKGDTHAKGFAHRLLIARRMAGELQEPTSRISTFGNQFVSELHAVDDGFRTIINGASAEIQERPDSKAQLCEFFGMVRNLSASAQQGLASIQQMTDAIAPIEKLSRDLRPVLRRLRKGLTVMLEGMEVTDAWIELIDSSGVDCEEQEPTTSPAKS
jgi:hypothetical protein